MKVARIAILVVALGAAGGAAMLAKSIGRNSEPRQAAKQAPELKTEQVLVASEDIALGSVVKTAKLRWQDWPKDAVSSHFITRSSKPDGRNDVAGAIARMPVMSGEPISMRKLVRSENGGFMSAILPKGMRAISTKISPETGAGGFILPNDRVDVILTKRQKSSGVDGADSYTSETILVDVRVLAIDQTVKEKDDRQVVVGKTATLELDPEQAEILSLGEQLGELSLSLRSLADATKDGEAAPRKRSRRGHVKFVKFGVTSEVSVSR